MTAETLGLNLLSCMSVSPWREQRYKINCLHFIINMDNMFPEKRKWGLFCYGSSICFSVRCKFLIIGMWVTSVKAGMSLEWLWPKCCCRHWSLSCLSLGLTKAVVLQLKICTVLLAAVPGAPASDCQHSYNRKPNSLVLLQNKNTLCHFRVSFCC